jgi:hypothetical protein
MKDEEVNKINKLVEMPKYQSFLVCELLVDV